MNTIKKILLTTLMTVSLTLSPSDVNKFQFIKHLMLSKTMPTKKEDYLKIFIFSSTLNLVKNCIQKYVCKKKPWIEAQMIKHKNYISESSESMITEILKNFENNKSLEGPLYFLKDTAINSCKMITSLLLNTIVNRIICDKTPTKNKPFLLLKAFSLILTTNFFEQCVTTEIKKIFTVKNILELTGYSIIPTLSRIPNQYTYVSMLLSQKETPSGPNLVVIENPYLKTSVFLATALYKINYALLNPKEHI